MLARIYDEMVDSVSHLDRDTQARVIYAYVRYQIYGELPDPSDVIVYSMVMAKQLDLDSTVRDVKASITNGAWGWRPVKTWNNSQKPKHNLSITQEEPKHNLEVSWDKRQETWDKRLETWDEEKKNNKKQDVWEPKIKFLDFVLLTQSEHTRLIEKLWVTKTNYYLDRLNSYIGQIWVGSASKKYKSHYFTILNWERRDWGKTPTDFAKEEALAKQRSRVREQIDQYLHPNDSTDVWLQDQNETFDRRWEILGT